jgi:stage II sporulation protein D
MRIRRLLGVLVPAAILALPAFGQGETRPARAGATLRVGLWTLWHDKSVSVGPAPGSTATLRTCEDCVARALSQPTEIAGKGGSVENADGRRVASIWLGGAVVLKAHGETLTLHNPVRISGRGGELVLAVKLPVESYVERVVASESGVADGPESLKALAIVVRSFALHQAHGHGDYDLCDSTHCQLLHWSGFHGQRAAAHAATLATAGETLWFHGRRAAAWFHQNCGGRTASAGEVWAGKVDDGREAMPWLVSHADRYCTAKGAREWSATVSLSDLTAALANAGLARPGWKTLSVAQRGESGRAVTLPVGRAMGWGKILSTWFEVSRQDSTAGIQFLFHGRGSGHGVGLCQAGAAAIGAQGLDHGEILAQYFSGAIVADEATGRSWESFKAGGPGTEFELETLSGEDRAFLPQLSQALGEAEARSGMRPAGTITVRAFPSTEAFREATLSPGWIAGFTEGNWIGVQPLRTLAARKLLEPVMRHEFLHALVEAQAAPGTPLWLREGLAEVWADDQEGKRSDSGLKLEDVDSVLANATTEAQSDVGHCAAAFYAARLLERFGRAQVSGWLRAGLPASAVAGVR